MVTLSPVLLSLERMRTGSCTKGLDVYGHHVVKDHQKLQTRSIFTAIIVILNPKSRIGGVGIEVTSHNKT